MVDSSLNRPAPQIEANLRDLLATIANLSARRRRRVLR